MLFQVNRCVMCLFLQGLALSGCAAIGPPAGPGDVSKVAALDSTWSRRCLDGQTEKGAKASPWVVAVLSPRMVYSLLEWPRMQREAVKMGFQVKAWKDPSVPEAEWQAAFASPALDVWTLPRPVAAPAGCLSDWLPIDHVPYVRVVQGEWAHAWPVWGVMPSDGWRDVLSKRLATLRCAMKGAR